MKNVKELPVWCKGMDESGIGADTIVLPVSTHITATDETCTEYINRILDANGQEFSQEQIAQALNFLGKNITSLDKSK